MSPAQDYESLKKQAALRAVEHVKDGMAVGLGTGSTAAHAVRALGERVAGGLKIVGVPTSERTALMARQLGIPLATLSEQPRLDVTIDGADEVNLTTLDAIKGRGGALLREKIVALASALEILIIDESKIVERLGTKDPVPVEVVVFGWEQTAARVAAVGCEPQLRGGDAGKPYLTDSGNYILDCMFNGIDDPADMAQRIKALPGVVEHGLFIGIAGLVVVARSGGVEVVGR